MKKLLLTAISLMVLSAPAFSLSPVAINQLNVLSKGTPSHLRSIANDAYHAGASADQDVTDVLAESLLQRYAAGEREYADALAWTAKALGNTGNDRYRDTLDEILKNSKDKRLNRHVQQARNALPKTDSAQYQKGSIDLDAVLKQAADAFNELHKDNILSGISTGMTLDEVYQAIGKPTAETDHITGKQFVPMNFKGGDLKRTIALYKGAGQVVFSQASHYDKTWRVIEVVFDASEDGQP